MSDRGLSAGGPLLAVVVPTRDERANIVPLYERLRATLGDIDWEIVFVDDDSSDGTPQAVRDIARRDRRVRLLWRVGRRGLSSACAEGIQASTAPFVAVIDADLQHDETLLPRMLAALQNEPVDVVVGSRYAEGGGIGDWDAGRARLSALAIRLSGRLLKARLSDPMSGFFMLRREAFEGAMRGLSMIGFKILLDILASSPKPLRTKEIPFRFGTRQQGESKFDTLIGWEFLTLLLDKTVGHIVPVRFVLFAAVGAVGIVAHLLMLWLFLDLFGMGFLASQTAATLLAMVGNFALNNWLTYRDMRLTGWRWFGGLLSFILVCSVGAAANLSIAGFLFGAQHSTWWLAGLAGAAMSLVWNYTVTAMVTWRRSPKT